MKSNRIKFFAIAIITLPLFVLLVINTNTTRAYAKVDDDSATVYKTKCQACHSPKAEKFYDPAKPLAEQVDAILKGKKGEKPPYMPAFADKGITEAQATALVEYMKTLKTPSN